MAEPRLFPQTEPFKRFHLPVGGGHELYAELSGRSDGEPVVVLHGGPGAGTSPFLRRFFDPSRYMAVLFDQRGAGRSRPRGSLADNTTWDLVEDIERLRLHLGVEKWQVFGGSWGSTLALLYAQQHPDRVSRLILRGIFTMTRAELEWFYGGPAGQFFPEAWADFTSPIPADEQDDLIGAYYRRLTSEDEAEQTRFARPWVRWESACAALRTATPGMVDGPYARAFARIESHFFVNDGWLDQDDQIHRDMPKIAHIPGVIVQGRYDMICPPATALRVARAWPNAEVNIVGDAGHALSERGITEALLKAMMVTTDRPEPA
ncbi:prolyl aminopeptidase [Rhodobacteraceae bacterium NNCM2]|nr:prolyl aminopeptidase [Coraliihabitans acroporae]